MLRNLKEKIVIWRYVNIGLCWGDWQSYAFMAGPDEPNPYTKALVRWEIRYIALGYERVPHDVWVKAGGYGSPYALYLRIPLAFKP